MADLATGTNWRTRHTNDCASHGTEEHDRGCAALEAAGFITSLVIEHVGLLVPCELWLIQRWSVFAAVLFLGVSWCSPERWLGVVGCAAAALATLASLAAAVRHVWLQTHPGECNSQSKKDGLGGTSADPAHTVVSRSLRLVMESPMPVERLRPIYLLTSEVEKHTSTVREPGV